MVELFDFLGWELISIEAGTKIIATTIQKFPYIVDTVANLKDKRFAVIIDEAHSSTSGKDMQAVTQALGAGDKQYQDADDLINDQIEKSGKQLNVSMFAFTATPKAKTLRLFGRLNSYGQYEAFHLYSMKQATHRRAHRRRILCRADGNLVRRRRFYHVQPSVGPENHGG